MHYHIGKQTVTLRRDRDSGVVSVVRPSTIIVHTTSHGPRGHAHGGMYGYAMSRSGAERVRDKYDTSICRYREGL